MVNNFLELLKKLLEKKKGEGREKEGADSLSEKAALAKSLLENPIFDIACEEIMLEAIMIWIDTEPEEFDKREFLWQYVRSLKQAKDRLHKFVINGEYEAFLKERAVSQERRS